MFVVVGLGNPGKDYTNTRHNVGFQTIDLIAERNNINMNKIKFKSVYGEGFIGNKKIMLVKPQTYMNNSGMAVREMAQFYKIPIDNIIVIVDDIDIEFATIRIRTKGSAGSHNGMKSIIQHMQSMDFPRIKIGIGKKNEFQDLASFVLSNFTKDESPLIKESILTAAEAVEVIVNKGLDEAMNKFNTR